MLNDKIKTNSVEALKAGDPQRVGVLRYLLSLIERKAMSLPPGEMKEEEIVAVIRKELKNKEEAKELFKKGSRDDLVTEVDYEIGIVKQYLPAEMTDEELKMIVEKVVGEKGKNFGMVMGEVMKQVASRVGGDRVSKVVKECLI